MTTTALDAQKANVLDLFGRALSEIRDLRNTESQVMTDDLRQAAGAQCVEISRGKIHYEIIGPADGVPVLLLPGATLPMWVWDPIMKPLADAGFRVVRFNYFGRGYSDCPHEPNDPAFFNAQIDEVISKLKIRRPLHIISIAFGGLVGLLYAEKRPEAVKSLLMIAPDGMGTHLSPGLSLTLTPGIGDYLFDLVGTDLLLQRMPTYATKPDLVRELSERLKDSFRIKGYKRSVLSSIREMPIHTAEASFRAVAKNGTPTMILWGRDDGTTPVEIMETMKPVMPDANYCVLETGHLPQYEDPARFLERALPFLKSNA